MTRTPTTLVALALLATAPAAAQAQGTPPGVDSQNYQEVPVGGTVGETLSLSITGSATFGRFSPGVTKDYTTSLEGRVTSTAGNALLTVADPSSYATGRLVNGSYALAQEVRVRASSPAGLGGGVYAPVGGSAAPTQLLSYNGPVSDDSLTLGFKQSIDRTEPLRTGAYGKTLTFTLTTTAP